MRFEIEPGFADAHAAASFHHVVDHALGAAHRLPRKSGGKHLHEHGHGGEGVTAGSRMRIAQLVAAHGIGLRAARHLHQCLARARIRVDQEWRGAARGIALVIHRQQGVAKAGEGITILAGERVGVLRMILAEHGAE